MRHGDCRRPAGWGTDAAGCTGQKLQGRGGGAAERSPGAVREEAATGAETTLRDHGWPTQGTDPLIDNGDDPGVKHLTLPGPGRNALWSSATNQFCRWLGCRPWWGGSEKPETWPPRKAVRTKTTHRNQTWGRQHVDQMIDLSLEEELGIKNNEVINGEVKKNGSEQQKTALM